MTNAELMKSMGSKTGQYDPEPPDQWKWQLEHGTPQERAVAWVKSKTIAKGHQTPHATDEHGKPLYTDHMAADLGWSIHTAQNVVTEIVKQGRIKIENKRILLCAEVRPESERRNFGENPSRVQRRLPAYVVDFIEKLPKKRRDEAIEKYSAFMDWDRGCIADAIAGWRAISAPVEDNILLEIGMEKKRLPTRREPVTGAVKVQLLEAPSFVQRNGETSYNVETGNVQNENAVRTNGVSLLSSDTDSDIEAGGQIRCVENQNGHSKQNGKTPARPPEHNPLEELLIRYGFVRLEAWEIAQVADTLGKTDLQLFEGILRDRLTRGSIGFPMLLEMARNARRAQGRIDARKPAQKAESALDPEDQEFSAWIDNMHPQPETFAERETLREKWESARGAKAGAR